MNTAQMRDVFGDQSDDAFDAAIADAMSENTDAVAEAIEEHEEAVLTAERAIAAARRKGSMAIAAIDANREKATAIYQATMERFARDRAQVAEDMQRRIATAEKLAAISRAALQAVMP